MVEVSRDGRYYDILDKFTGSSGGWQFKEYDLSNYTNESIYLRFRYTTDTSTIEEGFYVDDISPIADFETVTTISSSIEDNYYEITERPNGTYFYRVKGHNDERDWGDFSTLEDMIVGDGGDNEPPTMELVSPKENYLYILNREILPFLTTLIIGDIDIEVNAVDFSGIDRVEFYIDNEHVETVTTAPYNWMWNETAFFRHTIKAVAIDNYENDAEQEITVWKFF
jgi:hypothetical protein